MTPREKFLDYVKNGGTKPICSPQIGAGAGYDARISNKKNPTVQDTIAVCDRYDMIPLLNFGLDLSLTDKKLAWLYKGSRTEGEHTIYINNIDTPFGEFTVETTVNREGDASRTKDCVMGEEDLPKLHWYLDTMMKGDFSGYERQAEDALKQVGEKGVVDFQWGMQPYELFSLPSTMTNMLLAMDCEEEFRSLMDQCVRISKKVIDRLASAGDDMFVFTGGPGAEMVNPYIYEQFIVPYGRKMTDYAHGHGLLVYSHVCSPVEPFLTKGYFNEIGIDLFETLSMPPVGNVKSIEDAFSKIDSGVCTRGNVGMEVMINGTPDQVEELVCHIMEEAIRSNRKHIVAASDYLMAAVKEENVIAMCRAVKNFGG